jgi:Leucine-rich repeat (LRR) protein
MSEESPQVPVENADVIEASAEPQEQIGEHASESAPSSSFPLTADIVSGGISLLARTGNGLSFAYTRLDVHSKGITDLEVLESFPNLRYVDVSENALTNIDGLTHLEYILSLDVHANNLTSVPAVIDKRKYLQQANFSKNRISSWNVTRWPMLSWLNLNGKT